MSSHNYKKVKRKSNKKTRHFDDKKNVARQIAQKNQFENKRREIKTKVFDGKKMIRDNFFPLRNFLQKRKENAAFSQVT